MGFQKDKVLLYNMKPLMISLFILFITLILALVLYYYMPTQCKIKEALTEDTEVPYYHLSSRPSSTSDYAYINGIYCYPGDDECREYALTCTVGKDPNCHNNNPSDSKCYDASGAYICGSVKPSATSTSNYSCQTISGEYICDGNFWGMKNFYPEEVTPTITDVCKVEDGKIVCDESVWKNIYYRKGLFNEENSVNTGWSDQSALLREWGIHADSQKQSWYNFDYSIKDTPLLNYPLQKSDWNRYLESPSVDTKEDSVNSSILNKIYQQLYVLASRNDCSMGVYGCCSDRMTKKVDFQGSNCTNEVGLSDEVKKYIEVTVTKSASQLTPPPGSSIANAEAVPAQTAPPTAPNDNMMALGRQTSAVPPAFSMSSSPTDSSPQNPASQAQPIAASTAAVNPTAFASTNVLPAQTSYTNTVFLTGPQGNLIGNGPDPSFECKKGNCQQNSLPMPLLADFSSFV
jgi:hypothetical protein